MNEELNRLITLYGNQRIAADAIGVSPGAISLLLHRRRDFSAPVLRRIKKAWPAVSIAALLEPGLITKGDQQV